LAGANDKTLTAAPPYQTGPLGDYYLPTTTLLHDAGSRSAADAGLAQYTTQTSQTKDTFQVDIGLHYVATSSSTSATPKDTDGDVIPDYVEDANGNGQPDGNETDWTKAQTVSGTPDSQNTIYDEVDLSGDGLVGRIKKALRMNPFDISNPLSLKQVITGDEPDIATFEVPIAYNLLNNIGVLHLNVDGVDATLEECDQAPDGNCLLKWNTDYESPGQNYLQAMIALNKDPNEEVDSLGIGVGALVEFNSPNVAQFYEGHSRFDSGGATLYATTPTCPDATYTIELQTPDGNHIKWLAVNQTTSSGEISVPWNLTYDNDVTVFTGDRVKAIFNVSLLDPGSATQIQWLNFWSYPGDGNFDVAYANNCSAIYLQQDGAFWNQMLGVVTTLTDPIFGYDIYNSTFDSYWYNFYSYPGYIPDQTTANNLLNDLANPATENLYFIGHGDKTYIGRGDYTAYLKSD
jgi:hypothetical protein